MNDLELMERFRADVPAADPAALNRARADMFRDHSVRKVTRPRWQLAPIAGLAAAATIAVAVTAWPSSGPLPAPHGAQLLRLAADEARQEPPLAARPDQFVFFETKVLFSHPYSPPGGEVRTQQIWLSVDGSRDGEWHGTASVYSAAGSTSQVPWTGTVRHGSPAYRRDLPTDVAAMRRYLYAYDGRTGMADGNAWAGVCDLLRDEYLPPATTAALFEAAATIPGITVVPNQVDLAGRPGVAVSRVNDEVRQDLIFDPSTHRLLGERDTQISNASVFPLGRSIAESAELRVAIVDRPGQMP